MKEMPARNGRNRLDSSVDFPFRSLRAHFMDWPLGPEGIHEKRLVRKRMSLEFPDGWLGGQNRTNFHPAGTRGVRVKDIVSKE